MFAFIERESLELAHDGEMTTFLKRSNSEYFFFSITPAFDVFAVVN